MTCIRECISFRSSAISEDPECLMTTTLLKSLSMAQITPSLLELKLGLKDPTVNKQLSQLLYQSIDDRLACFLHLGCSEFDSLPAAACLLDPSIGICITNHKMTWQLY